MKTALFQASILLGMLIYVIYCSQPTEQLFCCCDGPLALSSVQEWIQKFLVGGSDSSGLIRLRVIWLLARSALKMKKKI